MDIITRKEVDQIKKKDKGRERERGEKKVTILIKRKKNCRKEEKKDE